MNERMNEQATDFGVGPMETSILLQAVPRCGAMSALWPSLSTCKPCRQPSFTALFWSSMGALLQGHGGIPTTGPCRALLVREHRGRFLWLWPCHLPPCAFFPSRSPSCSVVLGKGLRRLGSWTEGPPAAPVPAPTPGAGLTQPARHIVTRLQPCWLRKRWWGSRASMC